MHDGAVAVAPCATKLLLLLLLLCRTNSAATSWPLDDDPSTEAAVARWLLSFKGAELNGVAVGRQCTTCLRGVVATRAFEQDAVIARFPFEAMIRFNSSHHYSAEHAREWLQRMHSEPGFNDTWGLFWRAHPGPEEGVFTPDLFTDAHLALLRTPELEELVRKHRQLTEDVYHGRWGDHPPLAQLVPGVSLDAFKHVAALVHSRSFHVAPRLPGGVGDGEDAFGPAVTALIPVIDLLNHADSPSTWWTTDTEALILKARRPILAGEALTHNYVTHVIHRPDMSLFCFGFVDAPEPPLMAATDLAWFDAEQPFAETPPDDAVYDDPSSEYVNLVEYRRLLGRLEAAGTSAADDEMMLASGMVTDWRLQTILRYRIARKRALGLALDKLAAHLGPPSRAAEGQPHAAELTAESAATADTGSEAASGEL